MKHLIISLLAFISVWSAPYLALAKQSVNVNDDTSYAVSASSNAPTREKRDGLAVVLSPETSVVRLGQPVSLDIEIRNASSGEQFLALPSSKCSYEFVITNASNNHSRTFREENCDIYSVGQVPLEPGTSFFLHAKFLVTRDIASPGTYTVFVDAINRYTSSYTNGSAAQVVLHILSNPVTVTVV